MDLFNKKKLKEKDIIIEHKRKRIDELTNKLKQTEELYQNNLKNQNSMIKENQKLIEWIEKIINEVGVKTNNKYENSIITIPYYENKKPHYIEGDWNSPSSEQKDIIIPSIRFTKFEYKKEV